MEMQKSKQLAENLLREYDLLDWQVVTVNTKKAIGRCHFGRKEIQLSEFLWPYLTEEGAKDTILHEIAHALVGQVDTQPHGERWKAAARDLGVKNPQHASGDWKFVKDYEKDVARKSKYTISCTKCNATAGRAKMNPSTKRMLAAGKGYYSCRKCGSICEVTQNY